MERTAVCNRVECARKCNFFVMLNNPSDLKHRHNGPGVGQNVSRLCCAGRGIVVWGGRE